MKKNDITRRSFAKGAVGITAAGAITGFPLIAYGAMVQESLKAAEELEKEGYSVDIELDAGRSLLATITRKSLSNLNLQPGQSIYALIKAIRMVHENANL